MKLMALFGLAAALALSFSTGATATQKSKAKAKACSFQKCHEAVIRAGRPPGLAAKICRDKGCT